MTVERERQELFCEIDLVGVQQGVCELGERDRIAAALPAAHLDPARKTPLLAVPAQLFDQLDRLRGPGLERA